MLKYLLFNPLCYFLNVKQLLFKWTMEVVTIELFTECPGK
jgi:hypothetical protein